MTQSPPVDLTRRTLSHPLLLAAFALLPIAGLAKPNATSLGIMAHDMLLTRHSATLQPFLMEWPQPTPRRTTPPSRLPVLRCLPQLAAAAAPFAAAFAHALAASAESLTWRQSYERPAVSKQFLDNYGWTELLGLSGPEASAILACGVLILGPDTLYPAHHHEAEEIYLPLAGTAAWQRGRESWRDIPPGTVIHHERHESHAMRTADSPLMALYLWRSKNLAQKSQLDG